MSALEKLPEGVRRAVKNYGALSEQLGELCGSDRADMIQRAIKSKQAKVDEALEKVAAACLEEWGER